MKRTKKLKSILASLLVTTALAAPAMVLSVDAPPPEAELYFTGVELEMLSDGSIQAIFKVEVDTVLNGNGATFVLDYNPDYFTPSYMTDTVIDGTVYKRNQTLTSSDLYNDGFFAYDTNLYKDNETPFYTKVPTQWDIVDGEKVPVAFNEYCTVTTDSHRISMDLLLDNEKITQDNPGGGKVGKLLPLYGSFGGQTGDNVQMRYVFNKNDPRHTDGNIKPNESRRVILGRLSFWVNPDYLDEIGRYFPEPAEKKCEKAERTMANGKDTYLIRTWEPQEGEAQIGHNWTITAWKDEYASDDWHNVSYVEKATGEHEIDRAKRYYELAVDPRKIMTVRPAEEAVAINAYQAFTNGTWDDVAQALRRYSPMATATYVDGTHENLVIPWGETGAEYTITVKGVDGKFHPIDQADNYSTYNPLEGVYQITQKIKIKGADGTVTFHPIPIKVTLTVTPIKLIDVQVESQTLTYDLSSVVRDVESPAQLKLPTKARLITDIVPSGVSMVMDIPGWKSKNPASTWPKSTDSTRTRMNALKEDSYPNGSFLNGDNNTVYMPYWPDDDDNQAIADKEYARFLQKKETEPDRWIGEYTFQMADGFSDTANAKPKFTKEEIQTVYPWLTVEKEDGYPVPEVLRQIVPHESYTNNYKASYVSTVVDANGQPELTLAVMRDPTAVGGGGPMAEGSIFRVWLPNGMELGNGVNTNVWPNYSDTTSALPGNWFATDDGTATMNGHYQNIAQGDENTRFFHLNTNPGDPTTGDEAREKRELLRRYINLGGWYHVAVCEDPTTMVWSDPMPVFVPARPNEYLEDKVYNFIGENIELFNWPGGLTHYVTMPRGVYTTVNDVGERYYKVDGEPITHAQMKEDTTTYSDYLDQENDRVVPTTERYTESYGYHTTYDGATGAQPGTLYTFRVGPTNKASGDKWVPVTVSSEKTSSFAYPPNAQIWRYGPDPFYDGAVYPSYVANFYDSTDPNRTTTGIVTQPVGSIPTRTVTIRRNDDKKLDKPLRSHITLTSDEPAGITRRAADDQVLLADYDTRTVGYTDRQAYTFTITNDGDVPIYGLAIDGLTDGTHQEEVGGRFVLLQPPADFLAPGQSTTFTMTYVYNLPTSTSPLGTYRDKLYIISSDHPNGNYGGTNQDNPATDGQPNDYLLDFDAQFKVSDKETHTVTVIVNPEAPLMGDAGLIVGPLNDGDPMNYTPTARAYASGDYVYVAVYKKDMYEVCKVDGNEVLPCKDASGAEFLATKLTDAQYGGNIQEGIDVYRFRMPEYNTTVTVNFYEPVLSKLRIQDLVDFSAGKTADLKRDYEDGSTKAHYEDLVDEKNTYHVWRKSFTDKELNEEAPQWVKDTAQEPDKGFYLATVGTAVPEAQNGNKFLDTHDQYIVVIPHDAAYSQVQVTLRKLETHSDYAGPDTNEDIQPEVTMDLYKWGFAEKWRREHDMQDDVRVHSDTAGFTGKSPNYDPSIHTSIVFDSPAVNTSDYVRITVYNKSTEERRYYYLEIRRAPEEPDATLNYGNSPYGMIMNDAFFRRTNAQGDFLPAATKAAQDAVKEKFRSNGYTFDGLDDFNVPYLARPTADGGPAVSQKAIYWREAWVYNNQLFEPETLTGFKVTYPTPDPDATPNPTANRREPVIEYDPDVYVDEINLDLNDYAYFAVLGEDLKEPGLAEARDSTGRPVKLEDIRVQVKVTLLDTAATTQIARFSGAEKVTLDLGNLDQWGRGKQLSAITTPTAAQRGKWPVSFQKDEDTGEVIYTLAENIRPGQYIMEYVYGDYDGKSLTVTRPMVILPFIGDVNADGKRDAADETALKNRVADPLGYVAGRWELVETSPGKREWKETVYERSNIFKYRIVDVNNDRNVNNIDGNLLRKIVENKATPLRFYNPLRYINATSS